MKNKGRKHKALGFGSGGMNCKGYLTHITRPIAKMASRKKDECISTYDKKKWSKRVRSYFKHSLSIKIFE